MSPEDLLGYTDANHWTARSVQLDRWRMFGYNKAELFANAVNEAYLRPALRDEMYDGWEDVVIAFDDSQVVISPDRTEDALKAHKDGLISGKAAREALGWKESDEMEGDEREEWLAIQLRTPEALGGDFAPPERGPMPQNNGNGNAADGPPSPGVNTGVSRQESRTASGIILGAAQLALHRCRELAGVRIRHKCGDCAEGQALSVVASAIGVQAGDPVDLVRGGTDGFRDFLTEQGMLDRIKALSVNVTNGAETLGALIYLIDAIVKSRFGIVGRFRMPRTTRFRALIPYWVPSMLVLDNVQTQYDRFRSEDSLVEYLRSQYIDPVFYLDTPSTGTTQLPDSSQTAAAIDALPDNVQWAIFPDGAFLGIDAGSLELGIVRDSTLNSTNDFQVFGEYFRNVVRLAPAQAAYWVTSDLCASGQFPPAGTARTCD